VQRGVLVSYGGGAQGCRVRLGTWGGYGGGGGAALGGEGDRGSANEARETMPESGGSSCIGSECPAHPGSAAGGASMIRGAGGLWDPMGYAPSLWMDVDTGGEGIASVLSLGAMNGMDTGEQI